MKNKEKDKEQAIIQAENTKERRARSTTRAEQNDKSRICT